MKKKILLLFLLFFATICNSFSKNILQQETCSSNILDLKEEYEIQKMDIYNLIKEKFAEIAEYVIPHVINKLSDILIRFINNYIININVPVNNNNHFNNN